MGSRGLGIALDVGTTTVHGSMVDLERRERLSYSAVLNKQIPQGHDIITRIRFALEKPRGVEKLKEKAIDTVNSVIEDLLSSAKKKRSDLRLIVAVGNTALYHFTLGLSPRRLAEPPYEAEYKGTVRRPAKDLGVKAPTDCELVFLPNIGGFVGSDAIGVILAAGIDKSDSPVLAVDLGTNGEIILGSGEKIWAASTAAGPAFEGWHISCGMRAIDGAIESVRDMGGELALGVVGGGKPRGIAGSGLIDIVAILLRRSVISKTGRLAKDFAICKGGKRIFISQDDVRELQLAKAAISAGTHFLRLHSRELVSRLVVTGRFGGSLDIRNAMEVGIMPKEIGIEKAEPLPNGALSGAEYYLLNEEKALSRVRDIIKKTEHVPLGSLPGFEQAFTQAISFS